MRLLHDYLPIAVAAMLWLSCQNKETKLNVPLEPAKALPANTPLEKEVKRIKDKYGVTFNYRWNRNAFRPNAIADPAKIEDVLPYIEVLNVLFFESLEKVAGKKFIKKEFPIIIFLLGDGITDGGPNATGQAGNIQPNRLTLGGLNIFGDLLRGQSDAAFMRHIYESSRYVSVPEGGDIGFIYHEWTHYMDSKHDIPQDFQVPSFNQYIRGGNYSQVTPTNARLKGFMLPYGMKNEAEDFATYVQMMVWKSSSDIKKDFLTGQAAKDKYTMVDDYFEKLGLSLSRLRDTLHTDATKKKILAIKHKYDDSAATK